MSGSKFFLSFIICFQKQVPDVGKAKKGGKTDAKKEKVNTKKGDKGKPVKEKEPLDPKFIDCSQCIKTSCRIEYTLFNTFSYNIGVACWGGRAAKIYTDQQVKCVRGFEKDDLYIVCFSICHAFNKDKFQQSNVENLFEYTATFKFNEDKAGFSSISKNDNPKFFYDFKEPPAPLPSLPENKENLNSNVEFEFINIYETPPGTVPEHIVDKEITFSQVEKEFKDYIGDKIFSKLSSIPLNLHKRAISKSLKNLKESLQIAKEIEEIDNVYKEEDLTAVVEQKDKKKGKADKKPKAKDSKKGTSKVSNPDQNIIKFNASEFLVDRYYNTQEKCNLSDTLPYVCVIYSAKDVMKSYMCERIVPFSISYKKIYDLPPPDKSDRILKIFLKYSFGNIITNSVETAKVYMKTASKIVINHSKIFLLPEVKFSDIIETFQSKVILIKVYGVCEKVCRKVPKVYGQGEYDNSPGFRHFDRFNRTFPPKDHVENEKNDCYISNAPTEYKQTITRLLAYAMVDLSPLMISTQKVRLHCNLIAKPVIADAMYHHKTSKTPNEIIALIANDNYFSSVNPLNINEDKTDVEPTYYKFSQLNTCGTTLKVEAYISIKLQPTILSDVLQQTDVFSRIVVIMYDQRIAPLILSDILLVNEQIGKSEKNSSPKYRLPSAHSSFTSDVTSDDKPLASSGTFRTIPNSSSFFHEGIRTSSDINERNDLPYITGFLIDCLEETILMIEGLTNISFPRVLNQLYRLEPNKAKVLYNSDLVFTKRVYSSFLQQRKICVITMSEPISFVLSSSYTYLEGNIPIPAWKALLKLDLLRKSNTMNAVCKNNLLPTTDELLSFNLEFGIPVLSLSETSSFSKHSNTTNSDPNEKQHSM